MGNAHAHAPLPFYAPAVIPAQPDADRMVEAFRAAQPALERLRNLQAGRPWEVR